EGAIAALAIVAAGGVAVGVYPTLPPADVVRILRDCGATIAFCDTFTAGGALQRAARAGALTTIRAIVGWGDAERAVAAGVVSFRALLRAGGAHARRHPGAVA